MPRSLDSLVNSKPILGMNAGKKEFTRELLPGSKLVERPALFTDPRFASLKVDRPKRQLRRFGRKTDTFLPHSQCLEHFSPLFDQGGNEQQGQRPENQEQLNEKSILFSRLVRKRTVSVRRTQDGQQGNRHDRGGGAACSEPDCCPQQEWQRGIEQRSPSFRSHLAEQTETGSAQTQQKAGALQESPTRNAPPASNFRRTPGYDQGGDCEGGENA